MSPRWRTPSGEDEQGEEGEGDALSPPADEAERAEIAWLLAKASDPSAPAPSPQLAAEHAELEALLLSLPMGPTDDSWHEAVLKKALASSPAGPASPPWWRRRWLQWSIGGALAVAVALVLRIALPPKPSARATLALSSRTSEGARARGRETSAGGILIAEGKPRGPGELRVYRPNGRLLTKCPGGPGCTVASNGDLSIEITLDGVGEFRVILVSGLHGPLPEPADGSLNAYIDAALSAHAHIESDVMKAH
jgi:hypothetical protein